MTSKLKVNILAGYTYINPIALTPNEIYATLEEPMIDVFGEDEIFDLTYNNSSSNPEVLKYRYQHLAKLDLEIIHKK